MSSRALIITLSLFILESLLSFSPSNASARPSVAASHVVGPRGVTLRLFEGVGVTLSETDPLARNEAPTKRRASSSSGCSPKAWSALRWLVGGGRRTLDPRARLSCQRWGVASLARGPPAL